MSVARRLLGRHGGALVAVLGYGLVVLVLFDVSVLRASSAERSVPLADGFELPVGDAVHRPPVTVDFCDSGGSRGYQLGQNLLAVDEPVRAAATGRVAVADFEPDWDGVVLIEHHLGNGEIWYTLYGHLSRVDVRRDQDVARGERIGVTGPPDSRRDVPKHLHLEIKQLGSVGAGWSAEPCPPDGFVRPTAFIAAHEPGSR